MLILLLRKFCAVPVSPGVVLVIGRYWKKLSPSCDYFFPVLPDAGPGTFSTDKPEKALGRGGMNFASF
ncbi:MAG TPA: hypothetical protein VJ654_13630 [Noviherbaspirillum sp.]|nr:hypothetical protein [Noviherbaspirillum sp.]